MKTKEEQRELILKGLQGSKDCGDAGDFGGYLPIWCLKNVVREAMEMKPIRIIDMESRHRHYFVHEEIYSEHDDAKVEIVIKRMAEQGYIRLSNSGKAYKVLKTK